MNLSYLIPDNQYEFFGELIDPLTAAGIAVHVNTIPQCADLILCGILPITHAWIRPVRESGKPYILWHWDLYSFTNYAEPRWREFLDLLPLAADIWSCGHETARQLRERMGLESHVMPAWVSPANFPVPPAPDDRVATWKSVGAPYALYAASSDGFGKRVDWATRACELLGIRLIVLRNHALPRHEYYQLLAGCRLYICTAWEESNGTIPAMEAAALGKPVVLADLPASREVFGEPGSSPYLFYFPPWDFTRLKRQVLRAWEVGQLAPGALAQRILRLHGIGAVAARVAERLEHVHARRGGSDSQASS